MLSFSCVLLGASLACGQTRAAPEFEVASIKPSDPTTVLAIRRSGHRVVTTNTSLLFLITWAYDVKPDHLYGQPKWLDSVHYDITASAPLDDGPRAPRAPGQPTELQKRMQALLAERFRLAVHWETRQLPMYALVVAPGGQKFALATPPQSMGQNPFRMPGRGRLIGTQVSADMLANVLSDQLGRTVQDQTGLTGVFDFKLEWEPDPLPSAAPGVEPPVNASGRSSIFTAIQEQLGLKLEARRGKVDVLVIDRIESTPTEN